MRTKSKIWALYLKKWASYANFHVSTAWSCLNCQMTCDIVSNIRYYTEQYCPIVYKITQYCRILANFIKYCPVLFNIVQVTISNLVWVWYCKEHSDIVQFCQILCNIVQALTNIVLNWPILSRGARFEHFHITVITLAIEINGSLVVISCMNSNSGQFWMK